jgi:hypothetical protein
MQNNPGFVVFCRAALPPDPPDPSRSQGGAAPCTPAGGRAARQTTRKGGRRQPDSPWSCSWGVGRSTFAFCLLHYSVPPSRPPARACVLRRSARGHAPGRWEEQFCILPFAFCLRLGRPRSMTTGRELWEAHPLGSRGNAPAGGVQRGGGPPLWRGRGARSPARKLFPQGKPKTRERGAQPRPKVVSAKGASNRPPLRIMR